MQIPQVIPVLALCSVFAACQTGEPASNQSLNTKTSPTDAVAFIARAAQTCWFKSKGPTFSDMRMSDEVNSAAGRPRILLVKRSDPNGLPLLVIHAEKRGSASSGTYTNIQTFGPLLQTKHGKRIASDVTRWSTGNSNCKAP